MKLRGIHLRGHEKLGDISLDFRESDGSASSLVGVYGGNGTGKSLLSDLLSLGWAGSVQGKRLRFSLGADFCRLDFEDKGEILSIHIRGDEVDSSAKLAALFDTALNRHLVLKYDSYRVSRPLFMDISEKGRGTRSLGTKSLYPILSDLHRRDVKESIIVIDDFDLGLDRSNQLSAFRYLRRHYRSNGNQLIMMMREKLVKADGLWLELGGGSDPVEEVLAGIRGI